MHKINKHLLSLPPYISTSWNRVSSLHLEAKELCVNLTNGILIKIPDLNPSLIETIFFFHRQALEAQALECAVPQGPSSSNLPFAFDPGRDFLSSSPLLQHNLEQGKIEDLPVDILDKIVSMVKTLGMRTLEVFEKAEAHCNCIHCQVARRVHQNADSRPLPDNRYPDDELVSDEDLRFRTWNIEERAHKMYAVWNPFKEDIIYYVSIETPIRCSCMAKNCEHIAAVLSS